MNVLLTDLLLLYDEIGWIKDFFSDLVFNVYFVFICSFLLVWLMFCCEIFQHLYKYNEGNNFSFSLFSFFYHFLISIFDEMLDHYFLSQSFFITFTNKKQVTSSHLFSFFYHLLISTFFLSFLCLMVIFLLDLLIFVLIFCLMNLLLTDLLFFVADIGWIKLFFSYLLLDEYFLLISTFLLGYFLF